MSNKYVRVEVRLSGDGTSATFTIDLKRDPLYLVDPSGGLSAPENWFGSFPASNDPVGVSLVSFSGGPSGTTVAISGPMITVTPGGVFSGTAEMVLLVLF